MIRLKDLPAPMTVGGDNPVYWGSDGQTVLVIAEGEIDALVACAARDEGGHNWSIGGLGAGSPAPLVQRAKECGITTIVDALDQKGSDSKHRKLATACEQFGLELRRIADPGQDRDLADLCRDGGTEAVQAWLLAALSHGTAIDSARQKTAEAIEVALDDLLNGRSSKVAIAATPGSGKTHATASKLVQLAKGGRTVIYAAHERKVRDETRDLVLQMLPPGETALVDVVTSKAEACALVGDESTVTPSCHGCALVSSCAYQLRKTRALQTRLYCTTIAKLRQWEKDDDLRELVNSADLLVVDDPSSVLESQTVTERDLSRTDKAIQSHPELSPLLPLREAIGAVLTAVQAAKQEAGNPDDHEHKGRFPWSPGLSEELSSAVRDIERIPNPSQELWEQHKGQLEWPAHDVLVALQAVASGATSVAQVELSPGRSGWSASLTASDKDRALLTGRPTLILDGSAEAMSADYAAVGVSDVRVVRHPIPSGVRGVLFEGHRLRSRVSWRVGLARSFNELAAVLEDQELPPGLVGMVLPGKGPVGLLNGTASTSDPKLSAAVSRVHAACHGGLVALAQHTDRSKNDLKNCRTLVTFDAWQPPSDVERDAEMLGVDATERGSALREASAVQNIHRNRPLLCQPGEDCLQLHFGTPVPGILQGVEWTTVVSQKARTRRVSSEQVGALVTAVEAVIRLCGVAPLSHPWLAEQAGVTASNATMTRRWRKVREYLKARGYAVTRVAFPVAQHRLDLVSIGHPTPTQIDDLARLMRSQGVEIIGDVKGLLPGDPASRGEPSTENGSHTIRAFDVPCDSGNLEPRSKPPVPTVAPVLVLRVQKGPDVTVTELPAPEVATRNGRVEYRWGSVSVG